MQCILVGTAAAKMIQYFIKKKKNIVHLYVWLKDWTSDEIGPKRSQFCFQKKRYHIKEVPGSLLGVRKGRDCLPFNYAHSIGKPHGHKTCI